MATEYGKTWWGEQFLNSLAYIDYSNRLPRGRSYARNGYVKNINTKGNLVIAEVRGSRRTPYKVRITIPEFKNNDKQKLLSVIHSNPLLLSQLLNRELPPELNRIAEEKNIRVFPQTWKDFDMSCSCPDWAVPCKHLASVIYMLSAAIDQNPFLVFQLHGLDFLKELEKEGFKGHEVLKVPKVSDTFRNKPFELKNKVSRRLDKSFDLSHIPQLRDTLLSLIDERPVFSHRPFITLLRKNYKAVARIVKNILQEENEELSVIEIEKYYRAEVVLHNEVFYYDTVFIADDNEKHFPKNNEGFDALIEFLKRIPGKYSGRLSPTLQALYRAYHFSIKLIETGGFVPQIIKLSNLSNIVRWEPATGNKAVKNLLIELEAISPGGLIVVMDQSGKPKYLDPRDQAITLLSLFIGHFIHSNAKLPNSVSNTAEKIEMMFFNGTPQYFQGISETEIPGSIQQWLSRFHISNKSYVPIINIDDDKKKNVFLVSLKVENRTNSLQQPIDLKEFITDDKYAGVKTEVLQSFALLARDFPDIAILISNFGETQLVYDPDEFVEILLKVLPAVKLLGISVLLPQSLKQLVRPQTSMLLKQNQNNQKGRSYLSLNQMLNFEWQVAIGDTNIPISEFKQLVKGVSGVVNIKGNYVLIEQEQIQTLLNNLKNEKSPPPSELLKAALTEEYREAKITISDNARKSIRDLLKIKKIPIPKELNATLRPYQQRGFHWLYNNAVIGFGSILADDMGLGKTIQVITLLLQFKRENRLKKHKALIVVPTTLISNWQKEIEQFAPGLTIHVYHGQTREFKSKNCDIIITSYGVLRSDAAKFQKQKWEVFIIDEAQNIKNPGTIQTRAVKKIKSPVKIAMSGTPVENRLLEYWSISDFVNKSFLGSANFFKKEFAKPIELDNNAEKLKRFIKITSPFILRRLKTDKKIIDDLPEKIENDRYVQLTKEQAAIYQNVVDTMIPSVEAAEDEKFKRAGLIFKLMTALKQICNHPSQFLKKKDYSPGLSGKAMMLLDILASIYESNEKVLIFTQYKEMGDILVKIVEDRFGVTPLFLHGGVSRKKRDDMIIDFQEKSHIKIFILSLKAGGTGLNLTEANHVIHYDLWWNPAVEAQATDRAFRIGQKKNVMVYRMITRGSFEEKINEMIQGKKALANLTVSTGEKWIGNLSDKEISELVRL
jgi:SNF2 family DNA or RNA helicase/uncharacterized Zn finger protein